MKKFPWLLLLVVGGLAYFFRKQIKEVWEKVKPKKEDNVETPQKPD